MANPITTQQPYNNISSLPVSNNPFNYSWPVPLFNQDYMNVAPEFRWLEPGALLNISLVLAENKYVPKR